MGCSEDEVERTLEPLCFAAFDTSKALIAETEWTGDVNALREQLQEMEGRLNQCNLTSMKAISNLHAQSGQVNSFGEDDLDLVQFHEPMAYLDGSTRELVMGIILEKVNQMANGSAPPALMAQLMEAMAAKQEAAQAEAKKEAAALEREVAVKAEAERKHRQLLEEEQKKEEAKQEQLQRKHEENKRQEEQQLQQQQQQQKEAEMQQQQQKMEQLEKALQASKQAEAEQAEKLEVLECPSCMEEIEKLGIHHGHHPVGHKDHMTPVQANQQSQKLARQRLRELETRAREVQTDKEDFLGVTKTWWSQSMDVQTEMTGANMQDLFDAAAGLQAACSDVRDQLGKAVADGSNSNDPKLMRDTLESFNQLSKAQRVFERLWNDHLLRVQGIHRRERAPAGPKHENTVRKARELPPRAAPFVPPSPTAAQLLGYVLSSNDPVPLAREVPDPEEEDEVPAEDLDVQGLGLLTPRADESPRRRLDSDMLVDESPSRSPRPKLGSGWEPVPAEGGYITEFGRPKFVKHVTKTVSLALLGPNVRTEVETQLHKPLLDLASSLPRKRVPPAPLMELENVSDFLRQRRQMREGGNSREPRLLMPASPPESSFTMSPVREQRVLMPASPAESSFTMSPAGMSPVGGKVSRLEKSVSLPMLSHPA